MDVAKQISKIPSKWQRLQVIMELLSIEARRAEMSLERVERLAQVGIGIFTRPLECCMPRGVLVYDEQQRSRAMVHVGQITQLLGAAGRASRIRLGAQEIMTHAEGISSWIEAVIRPRCKSQWLKDVPLRGAYQQKLAEEQDKRGNTLLATHLMASNFRAQGKDVYPGRLLVVGDEGNKTHPVDDSAWRPSIERPVGVSFWGSLVDYVPGAVALDTRDEGKYAVLVTGESSRPIVNVPVVDSWIVRADTLRCFKRGACMTVGSLPLHRDYIQPAFAEIAALVRLTAISLLRGAPEGARMNLRGLSRVIDAKDPNADLLTDAITELTAMSYLWAGTVAKESQGEWFVLEGPNGMPVVRGQHKKPLTDAQRDVVQALLECKRGSYSKDELVNNSGRTDAVNVLKNLANGDPDWGAVLPLPGRPGVGYRLIAERPGR